MKILSTLALAKAMQELVPRYEQRLGAAVTTDFGASNELLQLIRSGEAADIAILTAEAIDQLADAGVIVRGSRIDLALSFVGLAVRAGAPKSDIASVNALKSALLNARSIAYSKVGASGVFFADLIRRLGIAEEINRKARIVPSGFTAQLVASGEADIAVQQISELMMVPGIEVVGRLPAELHSPAMFSAGVFSRSPHGDASVRLLQLFSSRESAPILRASGLEPANPD
jgi:molybdate transport system substrate-binding protein